MTAPGKINTVISNSIATITFFHPQSNSLPGNLLRKLADNITAAGNDSGVKVIVLKSEGEKTFCAGASFDELIAIKNFEEGKQFFSGFALVINAIRKSSKFVIARVQGKAVGGGVGLVAAADYALAVQGAAVRLSELAVGIGPFVVGPAVERKIGAAAFSELAINAAEWQDAQWAKQKGLYAEVYPAIPELDKAIQSLAERLAASSLEAMADLKRILWEDTENWDELLVQRAEISGRLILTDYAKSAISKLLSPEK